MPVGEVFNSIICQALYRLLLMDRKASADIMKVAFSLSQT